MNEKMPNKMRVRESKVNEKVPNKMREREADHYFKILNKIQKERSQINFDSLYARQMIAAKIADSYDLWAKKQYNE